MRPVTILVALLFANALNSQSLSSAIGGSGGGGDGSLVGGVLIGAVDVLMHPEYFMNEDPVEHPRDIETRVYAGFGFNLQLAEITDVSGQARSRVGLHPGLRTEVGASFTYRDRVMLSVNGGWGSNGYALRLDTMVNSIYHTNKTAELRLAWHTLPRADGSRQWSFGVGLGTTFQLADERRTERDGFSSVTSAPQQVRPYVAPEIARFTASGKDRYEVSLRYVKHLVRTPAWTSTGTYNGSSASIQASDDHLALMMRYHLGLKRTVDTAPPTQLPVLPTTMDTIPELACKRQRVTLKLWDDAEMDGDTVTVLLNGEPALVDHCLGHEPIKLRLDLEHGYNQLQVVARNEGRIPPNTARGILRRGKGREEMLIKTTRSRGEMFVLMRG